MIRISGRGPCLGQYATETQETGVHLVRRIQGGYQMRAMIADVRYGPEQVQWQLMLYAYIPGLNIRCHSSVTTKLMQVARTIGDVRTERKCRRHRQWKRVIGTI